MPTIATGGPLMGPVHLSAPDVGELEESFVVAALRSGWVAPTGPDVDAFEQEVAARLGIGHAVAVSSGTAALHLALVATRVRPGDVVLVPTLTFAATANAVVYTGAEPVFVDCDPSTGNLDPALVADALSSLDKEGRRVGALVPVDLFGKCADYPTLLPLCASFGVPVIEDAAEGLGATLRGRPAGTFGRAAALSFNGNKIITTSGGGMLLSADGELVARCRYLASQARQPVPYYEHTEVGYNYRLSNLLAALGRAQLRRLESMMKRRRALREHYRAQFAGQDGVTLLGGESDAEDNCWLTVAVVDPTSAGWSATELADHLAAGGIESRPVWKPMHLQPVFAGGRSVTTGAAERLFERGLALPSGSALDDDEVDRVMRWIERFLDGHR